MAEEGATPDLMEDLRRYAEAVGGGDFDAMMSFFAPDAVYDNGPVGLDAYVGQAAIRGFLEDWYSPLSGCCARYR